MLHQTTIYYAIDSIWKEKYQHQVDINEKLEAELAAFSRQLQEIKNASRKSERIFVRMCND